MVMRGSGDTFWGRGNQAHFVIRGESSMKAGTVSRRRRLVVGLIGALLGTAVPCAALAITAGPTATGATDPCAASEIARTIGSVSKSMGDYLDQHPETNQAMTSALQQQAGPQSVTTMKPYFESNPKVAADMTSIAQPLTNISTQCKLPISIPQAMGLMQQAQGGGLPSLPGGVPALPGGTPAVPPATGATPGMGPKSAGPVTLPAPSILSN
jgi:hemophore